MTEEEGWRTVGGGSEDGAGRFLNFYFRFLVCRTVVGWVGRVQDGSSTDRTVEIYLSGWIFYMQDWQDGCRTVGGWAGWLKIQILGYSVGGTVAGR